jgi:hypothetical protein
MSRKLSYLVFAAMVAFFGCFLLAPIWTTVVSAFRYGG